MLKTEDNEILTRVGPGTPMGNLLRRYWTPACLTAEIPDPGGAPVRVRLFGENLVAFRDTRGRAGLVQENCPHRGASLYFGRNEDGAIRCVYHGWAFDADGRCVDMPNEPVPFCDKVRMKAYPVHESGGVVWAYLGPKETMTPFRDFATDALAPGEYVVTKQLTTCNWVQGLEGTIDTAHISHLHQFKGVEDLPDDGSDKPGYPSNATGWRIWWHDRAPRLEVEDTWYGLRYCGTRTTPNDHTYVRVSCYALPFFTSVAMAPFTEGIGMYVPIDDHNTWAYVILTHSHADPNIRPGNFAATPYVRSGVTGTGIVPRMYTADNDYQLDRDAQIRLSFSGIPDFTSQDFAVTESMGPVYDRSQEQLGSTDRAVTRMRHLLLRAAKGLAEGQEPPAVAGDLDYGSIRGAEKILADGEDWHILGTNDDPVVREALGLDNKVNGSGPLDKAAVAD